MINRSRTCLFCLLLIALCLPAFASPNAGQAACVVRLALSAETAFDDPISRWLNQLLDMAAVEVSAARWAQDALARISLSMGDKRAFSVELVRLDGQTAFSSSLTGAMMRLSAPWDWGDQLLDAAQKVLDLPDGGRLIPYSGEGLARFLTGAEVRLRAWAALTRAQACQSCEDCGACEACALCLFSEAVADLAGAFSERFDQAAFDQNVLLVDITPVEAPPLRPLPAQTPPDAPDDTTLRLVREALRETLYAVVPDEAP